MINKRKICVVTGTRAEYGLLKPVMEKIKNAENLELQIIVTGMHLLPEFGLTINEIKKDGFKIDAEVPIVIGGDEKISMAMSIGVGVIEISQALHILKPGIVIIFGDRFEALAAAIAASYTGKVVAHISGGDNPQAGYDEYARHAITKLSHIHFASTKKSAERIKKLGEKPEHVFVVGSTALDTIFNKKYKTRKEICQKYCFECSKPLALLVQHPLSINPENAKEEIRTTLEAIVDLNLQCVIIYPNVDPGGRRMIEIIEKYVKSYPNLFRAYKNLPFDEYLDLMKNVDVMIGNSSSGIIESPPFKLPVVNIGERQKGRERAINVIDVPYDKEKIKKAILKALYDKNFREKIKNCKNPYGDGKASERIVKILSSIEIDEKLLQKKLTY